MDIQSATVVTYVYQLIDDEGIEFIPSHEILMISFLFFVFIVKVERIEYKKN